MSETRIIEDKTTEEAFLIQIKKMAEATKLTLEKLEEITSIRGYKCLMCYEDAGVPDHICTGSLCRVEGNRGSTDQYVEDVKDAGVAKDMYNSYYQICPAHMPQWKKTKDLHARMAASRLENQEREKQLLIEQRGECKRVSHMGRCLDCIMLDLMGP